MRLRPKVYKQLWHVNRAFENVGRSLTGLATHDAFDRRELEPFRALVQEAQAATNSYLAHAIDSKESTKAGRLFRRRIARERRDDAGKD